MARFFPIAIVFYFVCRVSQGIDLGFVNFVSDATSALFPSSIVTILSCLEKGSFFLLFFLLFTFTFLHFFIFYVFLSFSLFIRLLRYFLSLLYLLFILFYLKFRRSSFISFPFFYSFIMLPLYLWHYVVFEIEFQPFFSFSFYFHTILFEIQMLFFSLIH